MSVVKSGESFSAPPAICLFPQVNEPDRNGKYSVIVAFQKGSDDLKKVKKIYDDLIEEIFGKKPLPMNFKVPFRDGDQKMYQDKETGEQSVRAGFENTVYLTCRTKDKPCILDPTGKKFAVEGSLTHGRHVIVNLTPYVWDYKDEASGVRSHGFSFGLNAVQVTNKVEALPGGGGNRIDPMTAFSDVSGEEGSAPEDDPANYEKDMFG